MFLRGFYQDLLGFARNYQDLLGFTRNCQDLLGFYQDLLGFTRNYQDLTWIYQEFTRILLGFFQEQDLPYRALDPLQPLLESQLWIASAAQVLTGHCMRVGRRGVHQDPLPSRFRGPGLADRIQYLHLLADGVEAIHLRHHFIFFNCVASFAWRNARELWSL